MVCVHDTPQALVTNLFYITFKRKKSNAKRIQNTAFVVSDKIFHCQLANFMSRSHSFSLTRHRIEKKHSKNQGFHPRKKGWIEWQGWNNPVYARISAITWTGTDGQRTHQTPLTKASCCITMQLKHELSLLFPRGWDAAPSSGMNRGWASIQALSHSINCQVCHVPAE